MGRLSSGVNRGMKTKIPDNLILYRQGYTDQFDEWHSSNHWLGPLGGMEEAQKAISSEVPCPSGCRKILL